MERSATRATGDGEFRNRTNPALEIGSSKSQIGQTNELRDREEFGRDRGRKTGNFEIGQILQLEIGSWKSQIGQTGSSNLQHGRICHETQTMKQVFAAKTPTEAHFVSGLLEAEGIPAEVHGEWLWGVMGEIPFTPDTWPSVWILNDGQFEQASAFVSEYEQHTQRIG